MKTLRAQVRRRLLISYRVDAEFARTLVPFPFRPQLARGSAVAGVCMIGLTSIRPGWLRPRLGFRSENVAHRIAVEWDDDGQTRQGVYILERHSSSYLPVAFGGRLFPGVQRLAHFTLDESSDRFRVAMSSPSTAVEVDVESGGEWSSTLFPTVEAASLFHERGSVGWSPRRNGHGAERLELTSREWAVEPAHAISVRSSFFDALPDGVARLDSVLLMRNVPFFWEIPRASSELARASIAVVPDA